MLVTVLTGCRSAVWGSETGNTGKEKFGRITDVRKAGGIWREGIRKLWKSTTSVWLQSSKGLAFSCACTKRSGIIQYWQSCLDMFRKITEHWKVGSRDWWQWKLKAWFATLGLVISHISSLLLSSMFLLPCVSDCLAARSAGSGKHPPSRPQEHGCVRWTPWAAGFAAVWPGTKRSTSHVLSLCAESSVGAGAGWLQEPPVTAQPSAGHLWKGRGCQAFRRAEPGGGTVEAALSSEGAVMGLVRWGLLKQIPQLPSVVVPARPSLDGKLNF